MSEERMAQRCRELIAEAEELVRAGTAAMQRTGWEPGETDDEWTMRASAWLGRRDFERRYEEALEAKG